MITFPTSFFSSQGLNRSGLITYWDIQNSSSYPGSGSTINDLVGNSNGVIVGTVTYTGDSTDYLTVEGSGTEYIRTGNLDPYLSPVNTGTTMSLFLWVYPTSNGIIISEQGTTTPDSSWYDAQIQRNSSGNFLFSVWQYTIGSALITSPGTYSLNQWYYSGWTYNGTTLTAYVNGNSTGSVNISRQTPNSAGLDMYYYIGQPSSTNMVTNPGGTNLGPASTFRFGALHIYNRALSAAEVLQNYELTSLPYMGSIATNGLTLKLDATNSTSYPGSGSWSDIVAPTQNITLVNSPAFTAGSPAYFTFNGSNQYGTGSGAVLSTTSYTKSVWFYLNAYQDNNIVSSNTGGHFMFFGVATNRMYNGHSNWPSYTAYGSTATFNLNTWYNATLTFNTTDGMVLYINGVQDSTYTANKNALPGDGSTNLATFTPGGNLFNGRIARVYCYNRSLTAAEVLQNFNADRSQFGL